MYWLGDSFRSITYLCRLCYGCLLIPVSSHIPFSSHIRISFISLWKLYLRRVYVYGS